MSYDFELVIDTGGGFHPTIWEANYTANVAPMWHKAFKAASIHTGIKSLNGKSASECTSILKRAICEMELHPDVYIPMNPPNGWGNYESALKLLNEMFIECVNHPNCVMQVGW